MKKKEETCPAERGIPFFLAGGDPNWVPRIPVMGLKGFEMKDVDVQAPRSRRGRRAIAVSDDEGNQ